MDIAALSAFINTEMPRWRVPGLSIAIVKDGRVLHAAGYGLRDVAHKLPATQDTVYWVGSLTKAFTALAMGLLVSDGKLRWDTPVREVLPEFGLADPLAAAQITVRDVLCHRSGLPRHDRVWYKGTHSRREMAARMRHLPPNKSFRDAYQYNNHLYIVAGAVIEAVSGKTWEQVLRTRLLMPLGMRNTHFESTRAQASGDCALPYAAQSPDAARKAYQQIPFYAPGENLLSSAGALQSSVRDMAQWLLMQLGNGALQGRRVADEKLIAQTRTPMIPVNDPDMLIAGHEEFGNASYALGWRASMYRGRVMLSHNGLIDGFGAHCSFIPKHNFGVVVLSNADSADFAFVAALRAHDLLLGEPPLPWHERFAKTLAAQRAAAAAERNALLAKRTANTTPSRALRQFAGTYRHGGYGDVTVTVRGQRLRATHNTVEYGASHFHHDVFELSNPLMDNVYQAVFTAGVDGRIVAMEINWEQNTPPIRFERV